MVGGKVVYASGAFSKLALPPLPVSLDWSPTKHLRRLSATAGLERSTADRAARSMIEPESDHRHRWVFGEAGMWSLGCDCFAF